MLFIYLNKNNLRLSLKTVILQTYHIDAARIWNRTCIVFTGKFSKKLWK